jgi:hypothetical protein
VGTKLECSADPAVAAAASAKSDNLTAGAIASIDDANVELEGGNKFPLAACRHTVDWWESMAAMWRDYQKYPTVKVMRKAGATQPTDAQIRGAFNL